MVVAASPPHAALAPSDGQETLTRADTVAIVDFLDARGDAETKRSSPGGSPPTLARPLRGALRLRRRVAAERLCDMEAIEVSLPYNTCDTTVLMPTRVIFDAPGARVGATKLSATERNIDRPEPSHPFRPARSGSSDDGQ